MSISCFTERTHPPSEAEIRQALGSALTTWDAVINHLCVHFECTEDLHYMYGRTYGWALRFRGRRELLTTLYPGEGSLTVQVNLSAEGVGRALALARGAGVPAAVERARPYPEGRWLFVPVVSRADLQDCLDLIALRAAEKRIALRS